MVSLNSLPIKISTMKIKVLIGIDRCSSYEKKINMNSDSQGWPGLIGTTSMVEVYRFYREETRMIGK